jgi:hypothetical protein
MVIKSYFVSKCKIYSCITLQSVGYNGTARAYDQTGTGKTYTVGGLGKDDPYEQGIM